MHCRNATTALISIRLACITLGTQHHWFVGCTRERCPNTAPRKHQPGQWPTVHRRHTRTRTHARKHYITPDGRTVPTTTATTAVDPTRRSTGSGKDPGSSPQTAPRQWRPTPDGKDGPLSSATDGLLASNWTASNGLRRTHTAAATKMVHRTTSPTTVSNRLATVLALQIVLVWHLPANSDTVDSAHPTTSCSLASSFGTFSPTLAYFDAFTKQRMRHPDNSPFAFPCRAPRVGASFLTHIHIAHAYRQNLDGHSEATEISGPMFSMEWQQ